MRRFLYYIAGRKTLDAKTLAELGLIGRFIDSAGRLSARVTVPVEDGPAGPGCVTARGEQPPATPKEWIECAGFWLAIESLPPGPPDLERLVGLDGPGVRLADGSEWRIPLLRMWNPAKLNVDSALPGVLMPVLTNGAYRYEQRPIPAYKAIDELAGRIYEDFMTERTIDIAEAFTRAVELLAVNYRIGVEEAGALGLLDQGSAMRVQAMAVDGPSIRQYAEHIAMTGLHIAEPASTIDE